jgi:hypothetical protein
MSHPVTDEPIACPHCLGTDRLQFIPMLGGAVYAQCPCGYGWEIDWMPASQYVN